MDYDLLNRIALTAYVIVGPCAWLAYLAALLLGRFRMNRLMRQRDALPDPPPTVTVLIPAKDEGPRIETALQSALALDYPDIRVLAVNDRSTDDTGEVMDAVAERDGRLRVIHIDALPPDWLGKCHALHIGAAGAAAAWTGGGLTEWLLFVDSDVALKPDALRRLMATAASRGYDAVSILTRLECYSFWERLLLPVASAAVLTMYTVSLTNDDNRKHIAFANGQVFLIRRAAYEAVGGHGAVRHDTTEDVGLMRKLKAAGFRCRLYTGAHLASTRMYDALGPMFKGWARIYSGCSDRKPWRIIAAMAFIVFAGLSVYGVLASAWLTGSESWFRAAAAHLVLMTLVLGLIYRWAGQAAAWALLFPVTAVMQLAFFVKALQWCATGKLDWRGTVYQRGAGDLIAGTPLTSSKPEITNQRSPL